MDKLLKKFLKEEIALSMTDISESAKSRDWFLEKIKNKIEEKTEEPSLYKLQPFLNFGSYFKGTKVKNVDEYDILIVIDSNNGKCTQEGVHIGDGLGSALPNHKYDTKYLKADGSGVSPSKLLNWLKGIVQEVVTSYGGTAPERSGQAITARIESKDINIDLVPAGIFQHTQKSDTIFYNIPKGDINNGWILTNPKQDMELINDLAQNKDNFRNLIRIIKFIRDNYNMNISSFAIECVVISMAEKIWYDSIFINLIVILIGLGEKLKSGEILDTFDSKNNLLAGVGSTKYYSERIDKILESLVDLTKQDDDDTDTYDKVVSLLFNN